MVEPCVKVRLANAFEFWEKDLVAPPFVMDIIRQGYSLPFSEFPPRCFQSNNRSALRNPQFVESAILELLEKQLIMSIVFLLTASILLQLRKAKSSDWS